MWVVSALFAPGFVIAALVAALSDRRTGPAAHPDDPGADTTVAFFALQRGPTPVFAFELMGPEAVFGPEPVSEAEAERRAADFYLRAKGVWVSRQPVKVGGQFILDTVGHATTPPQSVRTPRGVQPPARRTLINSDVVVEVRGGKVVAVRAEVPRR
ncbi:MAG: hypothetical protein ACRC33_27825 [Gemmataceae bacterium]